MSGRIQPVLPKKARPIFKLATLEGLRTQDPLLGGLVGVIVDSLTVPRGFYTYECGNPKCKQSIVVSSQHLPRFCRNCGFEFDWSAPPPPIRIANVCPKCKLEYFQKDKFCESCGSALAQISIPLS